MFSNASIFFILLFVIINASYLILAFLSLMEIAKLNKKSYKKENRSISYPWISILIPAHNEAFNIMQTIDSICCQEYKNCEIIIINDGSTDNTLEVLKENYNFDKLKYQDIPEWDSIGHMTLISELENEFKISIDTDDIVDFSSFKKGQEILSKYKVKLIRTVPISITLPNKHFIFKFRDDTTL